MCNSPVGLYRFFKTQNFNDNPEGPDLIPKHHSLLTEIKGIWEVIGSRVGMGGKRQAKYKINWKIRNC
jgi:hypothetical protein